MGGADGGDTHDPDLAGTHRRFAVDCFNAAWDLLDLDERTPAQERDLVATALASRWHWEQVGTPRNHAIGDWQVSRAYAVVGSGHEAMRWARANLQRCEDHDLDAFVTAYAHEAVARAAALLGDDDLRRQHVELGRQHAGDADPADTEVLLADLEGLAG